MHTTQEEEDLAIYNEIYSIKVQPTIQAQHQNKTAAQKVKKISPSKLNWDELISENIERALALWLNYNTIEVSLAKAYYGWDHNISLYLDEAKRSNIKIAPYISILQAKENLEEKSNISEQKFSSNLNFEINEEIIYSSLETALDLADKKQLDYDLIRAFFENTNEPSLSTDESIIEFINQFPKNDMNEFAINTIIQSRQYTNTFIKS